MIAKDFIDFGNPEMIQHIFVAGLITIGAFLIFLAFLNFAFNWGKW
jgi:hypothetical protein